MTEYSDANHEESHEEANLQEEVKDERKDNKYEELKLGSDAKIAELEEKCTLLEA
jgi:hypothetical protein